jgi:hypothetical protein
MAVKGHEHGLDVCRLVSVDQFAERHAGVAIMALQGRKQLVGCCPFERVDGN